VLPWRQPPVFASVPVGLVRQLPRKFLCACMPPCLYDASYEHLHVLAFCSEGEGTVGAAPLHHALCIGDFGCRCRCPERPGLRAFCCHSLHCPPDVRLEANDEQDFNSATIFFRLPTLPNSGLQRCSATDMVQPGSLATTAKLRHAWMSTSPEIGRRTPDFEHLCGAYHCAEGS
jgi:hypothetical protein